MANYDSLINAVKAAVKANGTGAITGATLQATLLGTIEELTVGFQFMGVATPSTSPDSNDKREFYIGFSGAYANFGNSLTVPEGSVVVFIKDNSAWSSIIVSVSETVSVLEKDNPETNVKIGDANNMIDTPIKSSERASSDLTIEDDNNNVLMRLKGGDLETKNFDSKTAPSIESDETASDFSVADENGNVILKVKKGYIKTKNFDSENLIESSEYGIQFDLANRLFSRADPFGDNSQLYYKLACSKIKDTDIMPLIIVAGQSNADGRIPYTDAPDWLAENDYYIDNYMMWNGSIFDTYNVRTNNGANRSAGGDGTGEDKFSFDAIFAKKYLDDNPDKTLYAVRATMGGIGFEAMPTTPPRNYTWNPNPNVIIQGCNSMCFEMIRRIQNADNYAKQNKIKLLPIAFLWHQGEADATASYIGSFKTNLEHFISFARGVFGGSALPFINGQLNNCGTYFTQANDIFSELNAIDPYMKTVDMTGHNTPDGDVHYDASAIIYMGEQMYEKYKLLNI